MVVSRLWTRSDAVFGSCMCYRHNFDITDAEVRTFKFTYFHHNDSAQLL